MEAKKLSAQSAVTPAATSANGASASRSMVMPPSTTVTIALGAGVSLTDKQIALLEARGINVELAVRLGWRSSGRGGSGDSIEIPFFRNGREVNCKTRTLSGEKRFFQVEGGEKCFYNVDAIKDLAGETLVITEGEMDCIVALQCGFIAVSVPDGAPKDAIGDRDSVKYDYLRDITPAVSRIILAVDSDGPGANLMHDLSLRLGRHRCMWVKYPKGCKDLNDTFMAWQERGVRQTLAQAQFLKIDGLYRLSDLPPIPEVPAFDVGIRALADNLRLRRGDFSVVTGIPSHGKTTVVNEIAFNMARKHGWHVCFASFEQQPQTEHRRSLRTLYHARPAHCQEAEDHAEADQWINDNFSFIVPTDEGDEWFDMTWLKDRMAAAVTQHGAKLIVIDPWNELDHVFNTREMSLTQYVGQAIKELKRFARRFLVHVMVIAHPAKMQKNKEGQYPVPTAYDISDSSHWYNKPDQIVIVHRTEANKTLVRIAKSRYHFILGKPGDVELKFDDHSYRFSAA